MVEVRKREKETTSYLLRRFARRVQQSGIILRARKTRFYESPKSKLEKKKAALWLRNAIKERERLKKLGKIKEKDNF